MAPRFSRRDILRAATVVAAVPVVSSLAGGRFGAASQAAAATVPVPDAWSVRPFGLGDVSLGESVFTDKRSMMLDYGRGYDADRLLQVFRANAGLDTLGAVAPGGWEGLDGEANGNLRGHYTGHFLTMLSQAYATTGEAVFAEKTDYMIGVLTEVREALRNDPVVLSVTGKFGTAAENVRGSYQYIEMPSGVLNGTTAITLAAWVRPSHLDNWARIFDFGDNTTSYLYLASRNDSGVPRFALTTSGPGSEQAVNGTQELPQDQWSHVALTLGSGTATLYVNGTAVARNTSMTLTPASLGTPVNNWLGRSNYSNDPVFASAFDDVNIWSRALSASEITALQSAPAASSSAGTGDLASYTCDETSGGTFTDSSGRGRHATLRRTWGGPSHDGFLAAYPETQFITLESMTGSDYTTVWAPYYTAHKILRGLLDSYLHTGDDRALDLADGMCDWMYSRLSKLSDSTLQRMWGLFSSGEYGGIVETICDVYAATGKSQHLSLARLFDLDSFIDSCAAGEDTLEGKHSNQHIPILTGLARLYDETGEERYLTAAKNFWPMVVPARAYSIGGTSQGEFWKASGVIAGTLASNNAETCCAYNMLKLTRTLFFHEQDPAYLDYYERTLYNQILGSKKDTADAEKPLVTYFIGLVPGHVRDYTPKEGTTCCEGTGMESPTKYQDSVYFASADDTALYVNLYSPSTLTWSARGVTLTQATDYPHEQGATLTVTSVQSGTASFDLRLRIPEWATSGVTVTVNGTAVSGTPAAGSHFSVSRTWRQGDAVRVEVPFRLRVEKALDDPSIQTMCYGPVVLAARNSSTSYLEFGLYGNAALSGDLLPTLTSVSGESLHYTLNGTEIAPFFEGTEDRTHVYFRRSEPTVVFGGTDSGVTNPSKDDGTTLLDEIWDGAPFQDKSALVGHVQSTVDTWVSDGLLSQANGQTVVTTASNASYVS